MDEHDPRYDPSIPDELLPIDWGSFLAGIGRAVLFGLAAAGVVTFLGGCEDLERMEESRLKQARIARACVPEAGQRIVVVREEDSIHFTRIDLSSGRYSRRFPHVEIRIAEIDL